MIPRSPARSGTTGSQHSGTSSSGAASLGPVGLYDAVRDLPLEIEDVDFETFELAVSPEFTRKTTIVRLRHAVDPKGAEVVGAGEDVTYDAAEHAPHRLPRLDLAGTWTLETLSARLDAEDLFPGVSRRSLRIGTTGAGRSSPRRSTSPSARPACRSARRSAASRGRSASSRRRG